MNCIDCGAETNGTDLCDEHQRAEEQRLDYLYEEADKVFAGDMYGR